MSRILPDVPTNVTFTYCEYCTISLMSTILANPPSGHKGFSSKKSPLHSWIAWPELNSPLSMSTESSLGPTTPPLKSGLPDSENIGSVPVGQMDAAREIRMNIEK